MKSGVISLIGRPNAGKSTLLNSLTGRKIAITSNISQTTRNSIEGIYTDEDTQIIFVDTPGIHKPQNKLGVILNEEAYARIDNVDLILYVVDVTKQIGKGDNYILDVIKKSDVKTILILNKIDQITHNEILEKINEYKDIYPFEEIVPVSALKDKNIEELLKTIKKHLNEGIKYYDDEEVTTITTSFYISEIIREKVLHLTKQEVPHSVACIVTLMEKDNKTASISADIIVDRPNLKSILIGKNGQMIKEIGILSREELEEFLGLKVYLDLKVKVVEKWRDKESFLNQLGYNNFK